MSLSLEKVNKAFDLLKEYSGNNSYIISLKNSIFAYQTKTMNDFEAEYVLMNHDKEPKRINKIVLIADWYGEKLKDEWQSEFIPKKLKITWFLGETSSHYHFYCIYRQSQEKAIELFAPKKGILTNFLIEDFHNYNVDFSLIKSDGREIMEHQKEAVKFLLSRKKCILADSMGLGKTFSAAIASVLGDFKHILVICPASVKKTWENELKWLVNENDITIVQGSKWRDAKYTIINYDILDNFYTIPTQKVKKRELNVDDNGNVFTEVKEKEIVSRNKKIIDEAMKDSQLFQAKYDLIIIVEAHRL